MKGTTLYNVSDAEVALILAGLRCLGEFLNRIEWVFDQETDLAILDIVMDGDSFDTGAQYRRIDDLCERINAGSK